MDNNSGTSNFYEQIKKRGEKMAVLKAKDVMEKYSLSRGSVMVLFHTKGFPSYKVGNQWFVEESEMVDYLKKQSEPYKG